MLLQLLSRREKKKNSSASVIDLVDSDSENAPSPESKLFTTSCTGKCDVQGKKHNWVLHDQFICVLGH